MLIIYFVYLNIILFKNCIHFPVTPYPIPPIFPLLSPYLPALGRTAQSLIPLHSYSPKQFPNYPDSNT